MAVMDKFKEEREAIKNEPLKKKLSYYWMYYKWFVIIPLIIVIFVGVIIYQKVTTKDALLHGILLNGNALGNDSSELINGFCKQQNIDQKQYGIDINPTLAYNPESKNAISTGSVLQTLMAWNAAGNIDFIGGDLEALKDLAYKEYFIDLSDILTEEQFVKYESHILYIDQAIVNQRNEAVNDPAEYSSIPLPDCGKPEEMKEPIPVLLSLTPVDALTQAYGTDADSIIFGISSSAKNTDMALDFIQYVTKE